MLFQISAATDEGLLMEDWAINMEVFNRYHCFDIIPCLSIMFLGQLNSLFNLSSFDLSEQFAAVTDLIT